MKRVTRPLLHPDGLHRCPWPKDDPLYVAYHDEEWGVPERDDRALFEKLVLDGFQAGLSWITILRKRDNFRKAFDDFDPQKIARYTPGKLDALMQDAGIVRNRLKIEGAVHSARAWLDIMESGRFLGFSLGLSRRPAEDQSFPRHGAGAGGNARCRKRSRRSLPRAASSSSAPPSSTPSCRRPAWSTIIWCDATAMPSARGTNADDHLAPDFRLDRRPRTRQPC